MKSKEIRKLEERIDQCNDYYWNKNNPIVSDFEYDRLIEELKKLDPTNERVISLKTSSDKIAGKKVRHEKPMLSLDKVYNQADLLAWVAKVARSANEQFDIQQKYDGCTGCFTPSLNRLETRGDGLVGTDISHLLPHVQFHTPSSRKKSRAVGELLIPLQQFAQYKRDIPEFAEYKTPRNAVSGLIGLDPQSFERIVQAYPQLRIWFYDHDENVVPPIVFPMPESQLDSLFARVAKANPVPIDGLVFKLHDRVYAESLGSTQHHPRGAIAYKFVDEEFKTKLTKIVWQVGKEAVTPVAEFNTVLIDGVRVSRATLHNAKFVKDNLVTPGSELTVIRRGGVIPKIIGVTSEKSSTPEFPSVCPSCNQPIDWDGPDLVCTNDSCKGRIVTKIDEGLKTLGMLGIGPKLIERIVSELYITNIMDWCFEVYDTQLLKIKEIATAHEVRMLMSEFERITQKGLPDEVILASLCIPMVGEAFGKQVIKYNGSIMSLVDMPDEKLEGLQHEYRMNSTSYQNAIDYVRVKHADQFTAYYNLFKHLAPLQGNRKKICFTGALPEPRKDLEEKVLRTGQYEPTDNIRQADYLVCADPNSSSAKMKYARDHGTTILNFTELHSLLSSR